MSISSSGRSPKKPRLPTPKFVLAWIGRAAQEGTGPWWTWNRATSCI